MGDSASDNGVPCQVCGKTWPADHSICPDDGTWLYEQTIIDIQPKSRRSVEFAAVPDITSPQPRHDSRPPRFHTPSSAMPIRGASTDMIAAQLAPTHLAVEIVPGMPIGEYEIVEKVGEGAMGTVYRAIHPQIGKHVAIKVMTPKVFGEAEAVKRFVGEARAVAAIEHPGIVDVFGFGRIPDGRTYLVMEWLDGQNLAARVAQGGLPESEAIEIIRQIARALEAAHAKGIIHRDLKPENVFLRTVDDERPTVKLLDFGLAKTTNKEDAANVAKTRSGQMLGTPLYMSPEQCKNKGVDHRTDIYALGCMSYELLVGRTPYDADNIAEIITAHLVGEPPRASRFRPDIDPDLDKLLFGMIQKDADKRPPLGEIRRILGMQLSRLGSFHANTPIDGFAPIASSPFISPLAATMPMPAIPVTPPAAPPPSARGVPQAAVLPNAPKASAAPWFFYAAVIVLIVVVALIAVLK